MARDEIVRAHLAALVGEREAHMTLEDAVADLCIEHVNALPPGVPYSLYRLLEHIRIAQWDILQYIVDPAYRSPPWPEGYWPPDGAEADAHMWQQSLDGYYRDRDALRGLVMDGDTDLYATMPGTPGHTIMREILLVADHTAYHVGEFGVLRSVVENNLQRARR